MAESKTGDAQVTLGSEAVISIEGKGTLVKAYDAKGHALPVVAPQNVPTEEEKKTLRKVAGKVPTLAYWLCAVEFAERASYYGVQPLFSQYVNRPLPKNGNGYGAPKRGTDDTAGALGMGSVKATAVSQSFSMLAYALPVFFGWLADSKTGRFKLICWGVGVCGVAHVLMCAGGAKPLLANGGAKGPFFLSVYILAIGASMFKPNISPTLLDQMTNQSPEVTTLETGERVIIDPESTTERVVLWFYLLINVGAFMNVPTSYIEKYVGWWLAFLLPLILYLPLLPLLWYLKDKLILYPPGGSDLGNIFRILGICFKRGGFVRIFKKNGGFFEPAKPSVIAQSSNPISVPWNDEFVEDVRRTFQATGIFMFFPIQQINDQGLGGAANTASTMFKAKGVPNDVLSNFNSLAIIGFAPILNFGLYPFLRKRNIHFGPVMRITTGFLIASLGAVGYTLITWKGYELSPCGHHATQCYDENDNALVADMTVWWLAIPYGLGGLSELFVNVPAYGIAYSRAPKNMRGLVTALNLFAQAIAYAIGLATASVIKDPYLIWDFGGPAITGFVCAIIFYWLYHEIDQEEYRLTRNSANYHLESEDNLKGQESPKLAKSDDEKTDISRENGENISPVEISKEIK